MSNKELFSRIYEAKTATANLIQDIREKDKILADQLCKLYALEDDSLELPSDFFERLEKLRSKSNFVGEASMAYAHLNKAIRASFDKDTAARYVILFEFFYSLSSYMYKDE